MTAIANAWVWVDRDGGGGWGGNSTKSDGTYTITGLAAGSYRVQADASDRGFVREFYGGGTDWNLATLVIVALGADTPSIDFELDTGGSISGTVYTSEGTVPVGDGPVALAFDGTDLWVANSLDDTVMKLALDGWVLETFDVGTRSSALLFDGEAIWVANKLDATVTRLRLDGLTLGTATVGDAPTALAFDGTDLWVANQGDNTVTKLSVGGVVLDTFDVDNGVGNGPSALVFDGAGMWVANKDDGTVSRLLLNGTPSGTEPVGINPVALAFDGTDVWVANQGDDTVTKLSVGGQVLGTFAVGDGPSALIAVAVDSTAVNIITVANQGDGTAAALALDGSVLDSSPVGLGPVALAFDGAAVWIADLPADTLIGIGLDGAPLNVVPAAGANVWANDYDGEGGGGWARTDADGKYVITGLGTGDYRVEADSPEQGLVHQFYKETNQWDLATSVPVVVGQKTLGIDFALVTGGSISGTVFEADGTTPVAGAEVSANAREGG